MTNYMAPWTDDHLDRLRELWADGWTSGRIAAALNRSRGSIMGKVHRLGLERRPSPIFNTPSSSPATRAEQRSRLSELVSRDLPPEMICSSMGMSERRVAELWGEVVEQMGVQAV